MGGAVVVVVAVGAVVVVVAAKGDGIVGADGLLSTTCKVIWIMTLMP